MKFSSPWFLGGGKVGVYLQYLFQTNFSEEIQYPDQVLMDFIISKTQNMIPSAKKKFGTLCIVDLLFFVSIPIHLNNQIQL